MALNSLKKLTDKYLQGYVDLLLEDSAQTAAAHLRMRRKTEKSFSDEAVYKDLRDNYTGNLVGSPGDSFLYACQEILRNDYHKEYLLKKIEAVEKAGKAYFHPDSSGEAVLLTKKDVLAGRW